MRTVLLVLFSAILVTIIVFTTAASLDRGIFDAGSELMQHRWFHATLADAYLAFLTFYVWVAYKERTTAGRVVWFVAIMLLGNIAMATYVLCRLLRMKKGEDWSGLLLRQEA